MRIYSQNTKRWISITVVLIGMVIVISSGSCQSGYSGNPESITIGVPPLEQNALLYVAESQRLFDNNGLKVTIKDYDTGAATIDAMLKGEVDIAEAAEFPFIKPAFQKQPVRIIAINDRFENHYLIVRKDRGINNVADLKGKRIGVIQGTVLEFYLGRFLELHCINLKDVTVMNTVSTSQTTDAVVKGEIDAAAAFQPFVSSIQAQLNEKAAVWPVQNNQLVYGIMVSNTDWLTQHKGTVQRFLKCLAEAEYFLVAYPDEAKAIVQKRLNYSSAYIASIWPQHQFSLSLEPSLISAMTDEARWMINNHLTEENQIPDFPNYVYIDGLKSIKPEAVSIVR